MLADVWRLLVIMCVSETASTAMQNIHFLLILKVEIFLYIVGVDGAKN